jgi:hypothetical protein
VGFKVNTEREFTVRHNLVVETPEIKEVKATSPVLDKDSKEIAVAVEAVVGVPASKEEYALEVTFKHLAGEDVDYGELRNKLENISDIEIINEETGDKIDNNSYNAFLYTLRKGLISCKGFTDLNDKDLVIINKDGKVNSKNQIVVFEAVRQISDFFDKVISSYTGLSSKN